MSIKLTDILNLELFWNAEIISGENGLNKTVNRVASIERPFAEHEEYSFKVAKPGDIYISKLYVFDNSPEKICAELEFQNKTGACGLITHKQMTYVINDRVRELSDKYNLPIIAVEDDIGLTELVFSITDLIIKDSELQINIRFFENMLQNHMTSEGIREHIVSLDWGFQNVVQCLFLRSNDGINVNPVEVKPGEKIIPLYGGTLYIVTGDNEADLKARLARHIEGIKRSRDVYFIGQSTKKRGLENMKKAVFEAICASAFAEKTDTHVVSYELLGVFALLAELKDNERLRIYRDDIYSKIKDVDHEEKLESDRMIELYVSTGGVFKLVSDQMFTHEATIRYRMNKIRDHLHLDSMTELFTELKTAVYAEWILEDDTLSRIQW